MKGKSCFHCGDDCLDASVEFQSKLFCCNGCKTVFEIFSENDLSCYYDFQPAPGAIPKDIKGKYDYLDDPAIIKQFLDFKDDTTEVVTLYIPHIHCTSCIWILENLHKLNSGIISSQVNFGKKIVRLSYKTDNFSLKSLVILLNSIGYEPYISLDDLKKGHSQIDRSLLFKLGVAGFAFGNVMFLSFPEYFEVNEYWLEQYKPFFRWLMFLFSVPVVFYAAGDYFKSAVNGLRANYLNIDVPISLGILVLFLRSTVDIAFDLGSGFFDSLTGLVFFLLIGKFFQQKTYAFLSFERDYRSYFPVAVTRISSDGQDHPIQINDIEKGDRLLIRNLELIPVDSILIQGDADLDYSFVTGESATVSKKSGDLLYAGGRQTSGAIQIEAIKTVDQSYLTQLWSNDVFNLNREDRFSTITNKISKHFTIAVLIIAAVSSSYWLIADATKAMNVFTAVLIIACPCAIALSAPFTFGHLLRIFGKSKFFLKNTASLERLSSINTIIFDKTGTMTSNAQNEATYEGESLNTSEQQLLKNSLRGSNHPLSRTLYDLLDDNDIVSLDYYKELIGEGIEAAHASNRMKIGSATFVKGNQEQPTLMTDVHVSSNDRYKGKFTFYNKYRKGLSRLFNQLKTDYDLVVLTGDNDGERYNLKKLLPAKTKLLFYQKPQDKLDYIKFHQSEGACILMVGDGLNDAGALAQSDVGIAISENINVFSPACDGILDAGKFDRLYQYLKASKSAISIIKWSFVLSLLYNIVGLYFAVTGQLEPVIAAILMPLSSISIVFFTTIATNILGRKLT